MRITTTTNSNKTGVSVTARSGNKRVTVPADLDKPVAANHGNAAKALIRKVTPGYRTAEVLNSVKVVRTEANRTVYNYKDV